MNSFSREVVRARDCVEDAVEGCNVVKSCTVTRVSGQYIEGVFTKSVCSIPKDVSA